MTEWWDGVTFFRPEIRVEVRAQSKNKDKNKNKDKSKVNGHWEIHYPWIAE